MESVMDEARTRDLPLAGRQMLRLIVGEGCLALALGFGGADTDTPFSRPSWGEPLLQLPASLIPELRDAQALLEADASPHGPTGCGEDGAPVHAGPNKRG